GIALVGLENIGGGATTICTTYRTANFGAMWEVEDSGDRESRCSGALATSIADQPLFFEGISSGLAWRSSIEVPRALTGNFSIHPPFVTRPGSVFVASGSSILVLTSN